MKSPDISFVIIEYHSLPDVRACVESINRSCTEISKEIIVSSNSLYSHEEQMRIQQDVPDVRWVFNGQNGGFAQGMNAGLAVAKGGTLCILNPDVRIRSGNIPEVLKFLENDPDIGLVGPRIVDADGNLQDTCRRFMTPVELMRRTWKRIFSGQATLLEPNFDYDAIQPVDWVIGALMMVKRNALDKVGALDEGYFLYVEDMDWCKRFWDNGFKVVYYPRFVVEYKGDRKSTSAFSSRKLINKYGVYHLKSYLRFVRKYGLNPNRRACKID